MKKYEDEKSKVIREFIGEAVLSLLVKQEFSVVSVCDICKKAGVGRTTYYRYYGNKSGKEDTINYWLINRWEAFINHKTLSFEDKDKAFLRFIYSIKERLILLRNNNLLHILDSFIIYVYGPQYEDLSNPGTYYLKYSGAGIWMGLIRAIIYRDFVDSDIEVRQRFAEALVLLLSVNAN